MNITLEEKIHVIESSEDITSIAVKYLPDVFAFEYLFISYSHKDYKKVYKDLLLLHEEKVNFWYDRELAAGKSWLELARTNMTPFECKGIIFYISEKSLQSEAVLKEIDFAKKTKKPLIAITLPFESDYLYKGKSVKGKYFDVPTMLQIMKENKVEIPLFDEKKEKLSLLFPKDVIYLTLDMDITQKAEMIKRAMTLAPQVKTKEKEFGKEKHLYIELLNDQAAVKIEITSDLGKDNSRIVFGAASFANATYLETLNLFDNSYVVRDYAFSNDRNLEKVINKGHFVPVLYEGAFYNCSSLKEFFSDEEGINACKIYGDKVFYNCSSLETISIENDEGIDKEVFSGCTNLKEVNIESTEHIGFGAFLSCLSLKIFVIPDNCIRIEEYAFCNCSSLEYIYIGTSVCDIGFYSFKHCSSLKKIEVSKDNPSYHIEDDVLYNRHGGVVCVPEGKEGKLYIPKTMSFFDMELVDNCNKITDFEVDENNPELSSLDGVIYSKDKKEINKAPANRKGQFVIPDSVISISMYFNSNPLLESIIIGKNVSKIDYLAFYNDTSLKEFIVSEENEHFCSVNGLLLSKDKKTLIKVPLNYTDKVLEIPQGVEVIAPKAIYGNTSFSEIKFPKSVKDVSPNYIERNNTIKAVHFEGSKSYYFDK